MESQVVSVLVQGGAVGLCVALIYVNYKMATNHSKHIEAATDRFTQAMDRNSESWIKNAEALTRLTDHMK